jgi:mevalonate kinase
MKTFTTQVPGKWILAGEHAVLRGVPALVFPLRSRVLDLSYACAPGAATLNLSLHGEHGEELKQLVWGVLERACELKNIPRSSLAGELTLKSSIPVGAGMGASGALCVAVTQWMGFLGYVPEAEMFEFARTLENLFHGESSGVDIAVSLSGQGILYERTKTPVPVEASWSPRWFISYSGQRAVTLECVTKVKAFIAQNPELGAELDLKMKEAVGICQKALSQKDEVAGLDMLAMGIDLAGLVFEKWGLTEGPVRKHMEWLKASGAVAVKPTGSGGGGYVLSLWDKAPRGEVAGTLIPC